jgi:dihydrofolate synthase/folylpolyglutamate synthase
MAKSTKTIGRKRTKKRLSRVAKVKSKKAFKNYKEALKYLYERTDYEKEKHLRYNVTTFNLARMEKLLSLVGNPHKKFSTVHIAGTKGKGSTATMLAKMLEANDYTVGLYTSPHVVHLHERIMVNSKMISESAMLDLMNRIYAPVEKIAKTESVSFFEIMTALAFMHSAGSSRNNKFEYRPPASVRRINQQYRQGKSWDFQARCTYYYR